MFRFLCARNWRQNTIKLKKVNASKSAELLEKALRWFPESSPSTNREKRWEQLEPYEDDKKYESDLDELDTEFYKYEDNLAGLLHDYVRVNKGAKVNA